MSYIFCEKEHDLLRKGVREFAEKEIKPIAPELDEKGEFSLELTKKMGELGLFGVFVPEEYGGQEMDYLSYVIAVEEIARVDGSQAATVAAHNSLGIGPLLQFGSEEQKEKYLPQLCTGEGLWGFGLTEPEAGSDSRASKTTAKLKDGKWSINGSKIFITNASSEITKGSCVQAVSGVDEKGRNEYSTIIVEQGTEGFDAQTMHNKLMWRASNTSELYFDNCVVPEENLLGKIGGAFGSYTHSGESGTMLFDTMLHVFKMDMVDLGPLSLKEAVLSEPDGTKACQDYGKAVGQKLS